MLEWVEVTGCEMVKEVGRESIPYVDFGTRGGAKTQESKSLKENDWLTEDSHTEG